MSNFGFHSEFPEKKPISILKNFILLFSQSALLTVFFRMNYVSLPHSLKHIFKNFIAVISIGIIHCFREVLKLHRFKHIQWWVTIQTDKLHFAKQMRSCKKKDDKMVTI